jgi:hypothetical protein
MHPPWGLSHRHVSSNHGSGSTVTTPLSRLIAVPHRQFVWPDGNGSAPISSTWERPGLPARMAPSIASTQPTSTTGSRPDRLMRKTLDMVYFDS